MSFDRRDFIRISGASLSAAFLAACASEGPDRAQKLLDYAAKKNESVERLIFRHTSMDHAKANVRAAGSAMPSYYVSDTVPVLDAAGMAAWRLEVGGMVAKPVSLTLADLMKLERKTQRVNHYCVEGWTAVLELTGVPLRSLAALVQADPGAMYVDFQSFDGGYHESWDIESAMHPQTLVVYAKDGAALTPGYGAPARVHSPVKLGYKNTKYLTKIVFMPARNGGYWTDQGYEWYGGV
jgi:DMSO/TMAO reductase YedYZ molybdopterin-dependent catalytic subunit